MVPGWLVDLARYVGAFLAFGLAAVFSGVALVPCWYLFGAIDDSLGRVWAVAATPLLYGVWGWGLALCIVLYKRLIFYKVRAGEFPLFSAPVIKWGTTGYLATFINRTFLKSFQGTPLLNWYLRGMGATIGHRVSINTVDVYDWDLITIEDDVTIGGEAVIVGHMFESGRIKHAPVRIGTRALVGTRSTIMPGCVLEEQAVVGASSLLPKHTTVPRGEIWAGTPARFIRARGAADADRSGVATGSAES
jgi:non-ribosomal peptide synthetase-like protein